MGMRQTLVKTFVLVALVVGLLGLALAGCGSEERVSPGAPTQQTSTAPGPVAWPSEGSSPARLSGDGRYFGYIRSASADPPMISFDVAQFFYGKTRQEAAEADGAVRPGEPVSNDHYERNPDERARVLELSPYAGVSAALPGSFLTRHLSEGAQAECTARAKRDGTYCTKVPMSLPAFFTAMAELDDRYGFPAWVTIRDGVVVRIDEQFFP